MSSAHAVRAVFTALAGVSGIDRADVTPGRAVIDHDGTVTVDAIRDAIAVVGFEIGEAKENRRTLPIAP
ncbi:MAG: heavy-metal-associated domain-containing protein [Gemmatimonadaceae bacterium]|nr:heavy-metal-associated domain-containing protein [Gemmatimonadaceae bacterium]